MGLWKSPEGNRALRMVCKARKLKYLDFWRIRCLKALSVYRGEMSARGNPPSSVKP